jgi:hypothetical protein
MFVDMPARGFARFPMEDEDIHSGVAVVPLTHPLSADFKFSWREDLMDFKIFLERVILRPIHQMNACCICFAVLFNWMNRFGMRIAALEKRIYEIERHVIIDMEAESNP